MGFVWTFFSLIYLFNFLSPAFWETARYRLKYCLKGPLSPKQPTKQPSRKKASISEDCRICSVEISRASVLLQKFLLSQTSICLQNAAKEWEILGHRQSNLLAAELGICCRNFCGKISFPPLNIMSSVYVKVGEKLFHVDGLKLDGDRVNKISSE